VALLIARPWESETISPHLSVDPNAGIALGDSVAVARSGGPSIADAVVAPGSAAGGRLALAVPPQAAGAEGAAGVAIAAARAVAGPSPAPTPVALPTPAGTPPPEAAPVPVSAPPAAQPTSTVVAESGTGRRPLQGGHVPPIAAGAPVASEELGATFALHDEAEYQLSLWFEIDGPAWAPPGSENLLLRVLGEAGAAPSLGLQLWEWPDEAWYEAPGGGLWASGEAMGGERYLAALDEGEWHQLALCFTTSSRGDGGYALFLDGAQIDQRGGVSLIGAEGAGAELGVGLFREGRQVGRSSGVRIADPTLTELVEPEPAEPAAP
jgi:hypothetical protein